MSAPYHFRQVPGVELETLVPANSDADRALARLDATTELLPNLELLVRTSCGKNRKPFPVENGSCWMDNV